MRFTISVFEDEDGVFIAECPAIPGRISQGRTRTEAEENIKDAIRQCLEVRAEQGMPSDSGHRTGGEHQIVGGTSLAVLRGKGWQRLTAGALSLTLWGWM